MWRALADGAEGSKPKRIAVVGGGAAGMAAAFSLSRHPDKFDVTLIEAGPVCGGVACTLEHGGTRLNYGVQGGSPGAHANTIELMRAVGVKVSDCRLDVSFGKGGNAWHNYASSELQERLKDETRRFGVALKWISRLEVISIFVSIDFVLRWLWFSADFRNRMVFPLVALFFGTGNATPSVSAAVIARVFLDPSLALFDYDPQYLLHQSPTNVAFDDLERFYGALRKHCEGSGRCTFRTSTRVAKVDRDRSGGTLHVEAAAASWRAGSDQQEYAHLEGSAGLNGVSNGESAPARREVLRFDEVILACAADAAAKILGEGAGAIERRVLSAVEYYSDLTVTHTDEEYMRRHYEVDGKAIYFIKTYEEQPAKLEMGFDLSAYQPTLLSARAAEPSSPRVYQTIYLDGRDTSLWTVGGIDPSKVIDRAWWSAFSHTYTHFRRVVPWVWTLQGRLHTWFAGSWTMFNTHDIAIASGLAAAYRLGAEYPFGHNALAAATFDTVLGVSHLRRRRRQPPPPAAAAKKD